MTLDKVKGRVFDYDRLIHCVLNDYPTKPDKILSLIAGAVTELNCLQIRTANADKKIELVEIEKELRECIAKIRKVYALD